MFNPKKWCIKWSYIMFNY